MKIMFFRDADILEINPSIMDQRIEDTEKSLICLAQELSKKHIIKVIAPQLKQRFFDNVEYIPFQNYTEVIVYALIFEPDVVIVVGDPSILFDFKFECKTIFWQQDHYEDMLDRFLMKPIIEKSTIIAPSPEAAKLYNKFYSTNNIFGIYNGVQNVFFEQTKNTIFNKIVYSGSFYLTKGLNIFLQASKSLPELDFFCCGSFDSYNVPNKAFETYCMSIIQHSKNVFFTGNINHKILAKFLSTASICVVNPNINNKETCCCSALEAMAVGIPVIAGESDILNEIISHGGIFTNNLVQTIKDVLKHQNKQYNNKDFLENLKWSNISKQWEKKLKEIIYDN